MGFYDLSRFSALLVLPLAIAACGGGTTTPRPTDAHASAQSSAADAAEEKAAADAMVARFVDSWNRADGEAYGENYWPEAELCDPSGKIWLGRAAIVATHVDLWSTIFKGSVNGGSIRRIQRIAPTVMIVDVDLHLKAFQKLPPGAADANGVIHSHLKHVLEKRDGAWKIISAQNTFISALNH